MSRKGFAGTQNSNCQMSRTQVILLPCSDHHKLFLPRRSHLETVQGNCAWDLICEFFSLNAHRCTVKISSRSKQPCVRFYFLNFVRCQYNCIFEWSSSSLQSVHGISSSNVDNSQSTPRARQRNSTLQDPTLELQTGEYLFLITTLCAFTCNKFYVF